MALSGSPDASLGVLVAPAHALGCRVCGARRLRGRKPRSLAAFRSTSKRRCDRRTWTTRCPSSSRARCPTCRDGLKPVHRRILYAMLREGLTPQPRRYIKCAGVVGEVLEEVPPARRHRRLRRARPPGPALEHALPARRRAGQLRLASTAIRRPPTATPSARMTAASPRSCSPTSTRTPSTSRRTTTTRRTEPTVLPSRVPEPARQRLDRHRGRHGDEDPAAQPGARWSTRLTGAHRRIPEIDIGRIGS